VSDQVPTGGNIVKIFMKTTLTRRNFLATSVLLGFDAVLLAQQAPASAGAADPALIEKPGCGVPNPGSTGSP
jgi:hypothetical protein